MWLHIFAIELYLPMPRSLKEKRTELNKIKQKISNMGNISLAEAGYQNKWQRTLLLISLIKGSEDEGNNSLERILATIEQSGAIDIVNVQHSNHLLSEFIEYGD